MEISGFSLVLFVLLGTICDSEAIKPKRCGKQLKKCSDTENLAWATSDGESCEVFRNKCHMENENCIRLNANKPEAKEIDKKTCQILCKETECMKMYDPVCGIYNGKKKTFGNDCSMHTHICATGETFSLYSNDACPNK